MKTTNQMHAELIRWACIGRLIRIKYRTRVNESDHYTVAKQLRKQGISLQTALLILL